MNNPAAVMAAAPQLKASSGPDLALSAGERSPGAPAKADKESEFSKTIRGLEDNSVEATGGASQPGTSTETPKADGSAADDGASEAADQPVTADSTEDAAQDLPTEDMRLGEGSDQPPAGNELPPAIDALDPIPGEGQSDAALSATDVPAPIEGETTTLTEAASLSDDSSAADLPPDAGDTVDSAQTPLGADSQAEVVTETDTTAVAAAAAAEPRTTTATDKATGTGSNTAAPVATSVAGSSTQMAADGGGESPQGDGDAPPMPKPESGLPAANTVKAGSDGIAAFNLSSGASASAGSPAASTTADLDALQMSRPLQPNGSPESLARGLGERLMVMAEGGLQSARVKINPEHLGPLEIRIKVQDDTAQVWFNASHSQTRDALEQAMPRLRDMLADQGLRLTDADVSGGREGPADQLADDERGDTRDWRETPPATLDERRQMTDLRSLIKARRMLDVYA